MINFDIGNVNPYLIEGALIKYKNEVCKIVDMTKTNIFIETESSEKFTIDDTDWEEIRLSEEWLTKFGLKVNSIIKNPETNVDWIIKTTGKHFYITIKNDNSPGENPVIGIPTLHDLQAWFYRLTKRVL
jgi:hypothetical protein